MAAKDYQLCESVFNAYIAKKTKTQGLMSEDRVELNEIDILNLVYWYVKKECMRLGSTKFTTSVNGVPTIQFTVGGKLKEEIEEFIRGKQ